jgi:2C-methyl-D-erythritol 2,4-cyclodiphosphate synthase
MEPKLDAKELQAQQEKLKKLQVELEKINAKVKKNEKLSLDDTKFISELGWLSALAVTIASIAAGL